MNTQSKSYVKEGYRCIVAYNMTVTELKKICRNNKIKGYSKKNKKQLIEFINTSLTNINEIQPQINESFTISKKTKKTKDGRNNNKKDEGIRVQGICEHINNKTLLGTKMCQDYFKNSGKEIERVEQKGSNRDHYDLLIYNTDGTTKRCEEKGTQNYVPEIKEDSKPWENSVQFYNGPARKFSIVDKYLRLWYEINVDNKEINKEYDLGEIPSYNDWKQGGPYCTTNIPKGLYNKTLKENYRKKFPGKSMNGMNGHNIDYRKSVHKKFMEIITEEDKNILIKEVNEIYREVMDQKEIWLQTTGDPNGSFSWKWYDKIDTSDIINIDISVGTDIDFIFNTICGKKIKGKMRWGNGCGFTCFRLDLS